jgi:structural maintenance of chromosome 1
MAELGSVRETQSKEAEASGKITGLEKKIQYADIEKVPVRLDNIVRFCESFTELFGSYV